jgi:outer membrane protein
VFVIDKRLAAAFLAASVSMFSLNAALAETLQGALAKAYVNNSSLNAARAEVRVRDEDVAIAKSGYRPNITYTAEGSHSSNLDGTHRTSLSSSLRVRQIFFDGFKTKNRIKQATAGVYAQRESLRFSEQDVFINAVTTYTNVIRDRKIAALRKKNVAFLIEQVRSSQARFEVGEGTRTDVAQADASRAAAIAQLNAAQAQANASEADYRQVVGEEPKELKAPTTLAKLMPKSIDSALSAAANDHPLIGARKQSVDASQFAVKVDEGELLPTLAAEASIRRTGEQINSPFRNNGTTSDEAVVGVVLTVPIYQGGRVSAQVRQSKEQLGQARIEVDVAIDQVRAEVTASWGQLEAQKASVIANKQLVSAAQLALDGVSEERKVGQRTTLDVLNAQSDVVTAQINLVTSEANVVVTSYALLQAMGRLTADRLGLGVKLYKPEEHFEAVKDKWFGLRTPDQR